MNELINRTLSGAVYAGVIFASLLLGQMTFAGLIAIFIILASRELVKLLHEGKQSLIFMLLISMSMLVFFFGLNAFWFRYFRTAVSGLIILSGLLPLIILLFTSFRVTAGQVMNHMVFWVLIPLFFLVALMDPQRSGIAVIDYALGAFVFIWVNDTFAYLSGKWLGKNALWPSVSPKKTIEGLIGGIIFALLAAILWANLFPSLSLVQWLGFALLTAIAGTFGDLYESYMKRRAGVKDAGHLIPGHGGILDRLDSILFASPAVFLLLILYFA